MLLEHYKKDPSTANQNHSIILPFILSSTFTDSVGGPLFVAGFTDAIVVSTLIAVVDEVVGTGDTVHVAFLDGDPLDGNALRESDFGVDGFNDDKPPFNGSGTMLLLIGPDSCCCLLFRSFCCFLEGDEIDGRASVLLPITTGLPFFS